MSDSTIVEPEEEPRDETDDEAKLTPRARVRLWLREEIAERDEVHRPALVDEAVAHFGNQDSFVRRFLRDSLKPVVYELASQEMARTRGEIVELGDDVVTRGEFKRRARRNFPRFSSWMEHSGGRDIKLTEMKRADLALTLKERGGRHRTESHILVFERHLFDHLRGEERVRDRYTLPDLDDLWTKTEPPQDENEESDEQEGGVDGHLQQGGTDLR